MRRSGCDPSQYAIHITVTNILSARSGDTTPLSGVGLCRAQLETSEAPHARQAFPKETRPQVNSFGTTLLRS